MNIPAVFKDCIDRQMASNRGKNLFSESFPDSLHFSDQIIQLILETKDTDPEFLAELSDYLVNRSIREFCRVNQFYTFNEKSQQDLKSIYTGLLDALVQQQGRTDRTHTEHLVRKHHLNLRDWLARSNPFAHRMYQHTPEKTDPVPCSEYSGVFQLQILSLDLNNLQEPLLDIGCGPRGNLVTYLREQGVEAYGFDRFAEGKPFLEKNDWFGFDFGKNKWGSVVSNLAFSHHFRHHHFREEGDFAGYAKKYMEILGSLIPGGVFCYAPDLSFIESYLDPLCFSRKNLSFGDHGFSSSCIQKLR